MSFLHLFTKDFFNDGWLWTCQPIPQLRGRWWRFFFHSHDLFRESAVAVLFLKKQVHVCPVPIYFAVFFSRSIGNMNIERDGEGKEKRHSWCTYYGICHLVELSRFSLVSVYLVWKVFHSFLLPFFFALRLRPLQKTATFLFGAQSRTLFVMPSTTSLWRPIFILHPSYVLRKGFLSCPGRRSVSRLKERTREMNTDNRSGITCFCRISLNIRMIIL